MDSAKENENVDVLECRAMCPIRLGGAVCEFNYRDASCILNFNVGAGTLEYRTSSLARFHLSSFFKTDRGDSAEPFPSRVFLGFRQQLPPAPWQRASASPGVAMAHAPGTVAPESLGIKETMVHSHDFRIFDGGACISRHQSG